MSQDANNLPKGLNITTQIPLDVKTYIDSEDTLSHLGDSNQLAFTYPDGIKIYSILEKTVWQWRQVPNGLEDTGLLFNGDFTYPSAVTTFGIDYSNKKYNFFKVEYVNKTDEKSYDALSVGTGETIYKNKTVTNNNTVFNFKKIIKTDAGTIGIPVLNNITTVNDDIIISGKRIKTDNLSITEPVTGEILINTPIDPSDVKFYVNENYTGGNSNGSLSKPYTTLYDAFQAFQGEGTLYNPEYANIGTIELLSNITVLGTGPKAMTYLSINTLKLKGNGYTISYQGSQDYFISTDYLVSICPKTTLNKLDYTIFMSFKDVVIESRTVHKIINNLNYTSPSTSVNQNTSGILFENCTISDLSFLVELGSYTDTTVDLFGTPVYAQNSLPATQYMIKNKDVIWNGEGNFIMKNCTLNGSSSTILYNLNSSLSWADINMNFNPYYVNYKDKTGSVYNPADNTYYFLSENNGLSGRTSNFLRIENLKQTEQVGTSGSSPIGGQNCLYRGIGDSLITIYNGSFYSEKVNNLIQLQNTNSFANLTNFNCTALNIEDTTYGAFKYTGSLPVSPIVVDVNMSTINNVKDWTTLQYIRPNASSAIINGANFTNITSYANEAAAKAAGLVPGNIYYNTSTNIATRIA